MTTIAFNRREIACDSLMHDESGIRQGECQKIWRLPDGTLFAGAGEYGEVKQALQWMFDGCIADKPDLEDFEGVLVSIEGVRICDSDLIWRSAPAPHHAIGSGSDFARAVMHWGASPKTAVETAIHFDTQSGGRVVVERL